MGSRAELARIIDGDSIIVSKPFVKNHTIKNLIPYFRTFKVFYQAEAKNSMEEKEGGKENDNTFPITR